MLIDCIQQGSRDENVQGKNAVKVQNLSSTVCVFGQVSGESRPPEKKKHFEWQAICNDKNTIVSSLLLNSLCFFSMIWSGKLFLQWVVTQRKTLLANLANIINQIAYLSTNACCKLLPDTVNIFNWLCKSLIYSISDQRKSDLNVFILNVFIKFLKTNIKDITCSWHCYVSHSRELKHGARTTEGLYSDQSKTYLDVIKLFT